MAENKVVKENNQYIFKYQKEDINQRLGVILGEEFVKYREDFDKTQDYINTKYTPPFPLSITLDLENKCNLNCIMCANNFRDTPKASLSLDTLKKIMDECHEYKMPSLIFGLGSEPMMYKDTGKVIEMANKAGIIDIFFGTNGTLLNDDIMETLIKNKVSRIMISLDAATKETYKKVRRADLLGKIEKNIDRLIELKEKHKSQLPFIRVCFVVLDVNAHECADFVGKWKNKVDYVDFQRHIDFSYMNRPVKIDFDIIQDAFCWYPFYSLNIWANGDVTPCCSLYDRDFVVGNVHDQGLKEMWDSKKMVAIREQLVTKKFRPTCQKCLYFRDREIIDNAIN